MTLVIYTNIVSPHVIPYVEEIRRQRPDVVVKYVVRGWVGLKPREKISPKKGWDTFCKIDYVVDTMQSRAAADKLLRECDILYSGFREIDVFEKRAKDGKLTYYGAERWLKPYEVCAFKWRDCRWSLSVPGLFRLIVPGYFSTARRMMRLVENGQLILMPIGVHAANDFARLHRFFCGDWLTLFRHRRFLMERKIMAAVDGCDYIRLWGYFVAPSQQLVRDVVTQSPVALKKLLWVGRMLNWKKVDTLIRAVRRNGNFSLTLLGSGGEERRLRRLSNGCANVSFHAPEDLSGVRRVMREHDALILSSNKREGWGAVVSEAIEEGRPVIGTYESGSAATILPETNLFHAGDVDGLLNVLNSGRVVVVNREDWSAKRAAEEFIKDWSARYGK